MANVIVSNEGSLVLDGRSSIPKGMFSTNISGSKVNVTFGAVSWSLEYSTATVDGESFDTAAELQIKLSSFKRGGGDGAGVASVTGNLVDNTDPKNPVVMLTDGMITGVNIVDDTEIVFDLTGYYTYTGEADIDSQLPDQATTEGRRYIILNTTGAGSLKIIGNIFEAGTVKPDLTIMPGENYIIYNNGIHWVIV